MCHRSYNNEIPSKVSSRIFQVKRIVFLLPTKFTWTWRNKNNNLSLSKYFYSDEIAQCYFVCRTDLVQVR